MMTKRGIQWLSAAADDPSDCRERWAADPRAPYALAAGRYFDVVVIGQRIGLETFEQLVRRGMPLGPVMLDRSAKLTGFFLPSQQRGRFARMVASEHGGPLTYRYLDGNSVVVVPGPMPLSGDRYAWLRAPVRRPEATPARVAALAAMLVATSELVDRAERYEEAHAAIDARLVESAEAVSEL